MMTIDQIATAPLDRLTAELAAAGWDSTQTELSDAREAVARLLYSDVGPFLLCDSENGDTIRRATEAETVESVLAGPEGHIMVDGRRCYVAA